LDKYPALVRYSLFWRVLLLLLLLRFPRTRRARAARAKKQ
jgi:hypothetical protein